MERPGMLLMRSFLTKGSKPGCAIVLGEECGISLCNTEPAGWPSRGVREAGVVAGGLSPTSRMRSGRAERGGDCWWWDTEWQLFWGREIAPPWGPDWRNGSEIESWRARGWSNSSETRPRQASGWSGSSETGPRWAPGGEWYLGEVFSTRSLVEFLNVPTSGPLIRRRRVGVSPWCWWGRVDLGEVVAGDAAARSRIFFR